MARPGVVALGVLCAVYAALAILPSAPGSDIVLATAGGSPEWLLGPFRAFGASGADGPLAGPPFYAGLWIAFGLYGFVLWRRGEVGMRAVVAVVVGLHVLFALAPPLLSQDVFSYIAYARLGVEHDLSPYTHAPQDIPLDAVFPFAGSKDAVSVYGPAFTLATYPLGAIGVPAAFWILKVAMALASLGVVGLVGLTAKRLGRDPLFAVLFVGLNPLTLVHVVGGAHNEALTMLIVMSGVWLWAGSRQAAGTAATVAGAGVKASAVIVTPFLALGSERPWRSIAAGVGVAVGLVLLAAAAYGSDALDAFGLLSSNQDRTSRFSFPHVTGELIGSIDTARALFGLAFAAVALCLMWRTWRRGADPIRMAGWTTFAVLVASAWLVPWYALWLLPLAALAADRRLVITSLALCAWMLAIAVPL
ncbi:MAG: DUF2029 domain-containing protein [Thermoleophilaceae bacterium]|nr:DUF2029 domain-containing protein [Thermoleophilaceae bacterium]